MDDTKSDEQDVNELIVAGSAQASYEKYLDRPVATSDNVIRADVCRRGFVPVGSTYREFFSTMFPS